MKKIDKQKIYKLKELCPKTVSGKHLFLDRVDAPGYGYSNSDTYRRCNACGLIDDLKEEEKQ